MALRRIAAKLIKMERVMRSGSEFLPELSNVFQALRALADFLCWTLCWTFHYAPSMDEVFVNGSLSEE